jgi:hypothetical protein
MFSFLISALFPAVTLAANPYTVLMDQRMNKAQHQLDVAEKKKGDEQKRLLQKNLAMMKESLRRMSQNMAKMDKKMEGMIRKYKSEHHVQMANMMQSMVQEHIYVLKVLNQMVERREIRNGILSKHSGK